MVSACPSPAMDAGLSSIAHGPFRSGWQEMLEGCHCLRRLTASFFSRDERDGVPEGEAVRRGAPGADPDRDARVPGHPDPGRHGAAGGLLTDFALAAG